MLQLTFRQVARWSKFHVHICKTAQHNGSYKTLAKHTNNSSSSFSAEPTSLVPVFLHREQIGFLSQRHMSLVTLLTSYCVLTAIYHPAFQYRSKIRYTYFSIIVEITSNANFFEPVSEMCMFVTFFFSSSLTSIQLARLVHVAMEDESPERALILVFCSKMY